MEHFDIVIIGAGISGIDAACHFKMKCPKKSFIIFEGRDTIGGTWDLFKYPGIRSDSDMHTFAFGFKPWTTKKTIASAAEIMDYLQETVEEYKVEQHIRFRHFISGANWSSNDKKWTIQGINKLTQETVEVTCNFLMICAGYYDYNEGYTPDYKGFSDYQGQFIHPQKWTEDIDYEDKNIVVIGSGATAVTLVPALAQKAKHVTMLQRSPSYILSRPSYDKFARRVHKYLPAKMAHSLSKWNNVLMSMYLYRMSKQKPKAVKKYIKSRIRKVLGKDYDVNTHFNPDYNPWDQRLCAVPDNDLFKAIRDEKCTVVTDHIEHFTAQGILLKSGEELQADMIVSATGLKLKMVGGMEISIDGKVANASNSVNYKGIMLQNMPNMAIVFGYTNASWTLKADLSCNYICRLLKYMDRKNYKVCKPVLTESTEDARPFLDFSSGYVKRALDILPKQGTKYPWKLHQNYIKDMMTLKFRKINDGHLQFEK